LANFLPAALRLYGRDLMRGANLLLGLTGLFLFTPNAIHGQPPAKLEFEVASVKPSQPGASAAAIRILPGGQTYLLTNVTLKNMIFVAYDVTADRVSGGPNWADSDRFDVEGKTDHATTRPERMQLLQALLADRFKLVLRRQTKEAPVYALTVDKRGLKLHENTDKGLSQMTPIARGQTNFHNIPMQVLTGQFLTGASARPVVDETGLKASYDFDLKYTPDPQGGAAASDSTFPDLATALREQLGLRLEPQKRPVDFLIIDHAERPTDN
jgi:uncharacterized protein (TIGR03435 family)